MNVAKPQVDEMTSTRTAGMGGAQITEKPFAQNNDSNVLAKGRDVGQQESSAASNTVEKPYAANNSTNFPAKSSDQSRHTTLDNQRDAVVDKIERPYAENPKST